MFVFSELKYFNLFCTIATTIDFFQQSAPKQLRQRTRSTHSSSSMSGVPIADHESLSNNIAQFNAERASFLRQVIRRKHNKVYEGIITLSWEICVQLTDMIDYTDKGSGGKICDDHALIQVRPETHHTAAFARPEQLR